MQRESGGPSVIDHCAERKIKQFVILAVVVGFELLLSVVRSDGAAKLTIGYATVTARLMPLWIAHEQGILAKYGIEAQPILSRGAPTLVAGLASGDLHIGRTGGSAMLAATAAGHEFKFLASFSS